MRLRLSPALTSIVVSALVLLPALTLAQQSLLTRHVRPVLSNGHVVPIGPLSPTQHLQLSITLPLRNQGELTNLLSKLYDKSSPDYHKFLSVAQFTEQFEPTAEDYQSAVNFLQANGFTITKAPGNRQLVNVDGSVAQIEKAFHVSMKVYRHPTENRTFYSPDQEPTVDLNVPLWHIAGLDNYSIPHPALVSRNPTATPNATVGSGPSSSFLGSDMRAAYYGGTALNGSGQSLGLFEYAGTDLADLTTYFNNVGQTNSVPISLVSTDGSSTSCLASNGCDDTEQTLDMTQAIGMAPGLSSLVMYVGSSDSAIFNAMATANPLNAQLSISWVWTPSSPTADDPYFERFAAQGQNVFAASGDWGAWPASEPAFPAEDPYVTSVGGTDLNTNSAGGSWSSETVWVDTGGGIAPDHYPIPSWQTTAAAGCASCSKTYRNGPDVAANANWSFYTCAKQTTCLANTYGGTSFAAPMWAGLLALANQQSVANGNGLLGFINPALYAIGEGSSYNSDFYDIISGSNNVYSATTGYDLVTGWGSPNGQNLINALAGPSKSQYRPTAYDDEGIDDPNDGWSTTTSPTGPFTGSPTSIYTATVNAPAAFDYDQGGVLDEIWSLQGQCTWLGFPSHTDSNNLTLYVPYFIYGVQPSGNGAYYSVTATIGGSNVTLYSAFVGSGYNTSGVLTATVPAGTNLSSIQVTVSASPEDENPGNPQTIYQGISIDIYVQ